MKPASLIIFIAIVFSILTGCKQGREKPPIPQQKMQNVLLDIHLAEAYSQGLSDSTNRFEKNYDSLTVFYKSILKHHNITFDQFKEAMTWYKNRPVEMDSLYSKVLNQLNELKAKEGIRDIEVDVPTTAPIAPPSASPLQADSLKRDTTNSKKDIPINKAISKPTTKQEE